MPKARSGRAAATLSHVDDFGHVRMVDISAKVPTAREAVAEADVKVSAKARRAVRAGGVKKGNPLEVARIAGILAAKRTAELIPLCHQVPLSHVSVDIAATRVGYRIIGRARTTGQTGVEMEALVAVTMAALTIYDMLKAVDRAIVIGPISLAEKRGGRSGVYRRSR